MIGYLNMPFFKRDGVLNKMYMDEIGLYLLKDEKIDEKLPMFVSGEVAMLFTDNRMFFVRRPQNEEGMDKVFEIEFLPYKSIQRFSFLKSTCGKDYCVYVNLSDEAFFSFALDDLGTATRILEIIGKKSA